MRFGGALGVFAAAADEPAAADSTVIVRTTKASRPRRPAAKVLGPQSAAVRMRVGAVVVMDPPFLSVAAKFTSS
jgi:hypothetical protein